MKPSGSVDYFGLYVSVDVPCCNAYSVGRASG